MFSFEPIVGYNAVVGRCCSGENGCVSRPCVGGHVVVLKVARVRAFSHEAFESAFAVVVPEAVDVVVTHLINGNSDYNGWKLLVGRRSCFFLSES